MTANTAYRAGVAIAAITSLLSVWTTVVRDDGNGIGFFFVILAAGVGGFAAWFRPAGMARTMLGVAIMQALLGAAIATAPVTAAIPGAAVRISIACGAFAAFWLVSGLCFLIAARKGQAATT